MPDLRDYGLGFVEDVEPAINEPDTDDGPTLSEAHRPADRPRYIIICSCGWSSADFYGSLDRPLEQKASDIMSSHGQRCARETQLKATWIPDA